MFHFAVCIMTVLPQLLSLTQAHYSLFMVLHFPLNEFSFHKNHSFARVKPKETHPNPLHSQQPQHSSQESLLGKRITEPAPHNEKQTKIKGPYSFRGAKCYRQDSNNLQTQSRMVPQWRQKYHERKTEDRWSGETWRGRYRGVPPATTEPWN